MASNTATDDLLIDTGLLRDAFAARGRTWLPLGVIAAVVLVVAVLAIFPQSYTAATTVAVQQGGGDSSPLAALTGAKSSSRYLGVLKSRTAAETVIGSTQFHSFFHFKTKADENEFVQKRLKVDDDAASGLTSVSISLPGPPRLALGQDRKRHAIQQLAADMANAYVDFLRSYYVNNDNDREAVILRGAEAEASQARQDYERSVARLTSFGTSLQKVDPRAIPNPNKNDSPPAVDELGDLYTSLAKVETQLTALQASQGATTSMTAKQLGTLGNIPTEDPLLAAARSRVAQDRAELQALQVTYGPDYPAIILAKSRLKVDQQALADQMRGVRQQRTSQNVVNKADIENLTAQRQSLEAQIGAATTRLKRGRNLSSSLERLRTEVAIRLEVLKTTLTEAARVRMQYASVQSRISVIDPAIPSTRGEPSLFVVLAAVLVIILAAYVVASLLTYGRLCNEDKEARQSMSPGGDLLANGNAPEVEGVGGFRA